MNQQAFPSKMIHEDYLNNRAQPAVYALDQAHAVTRLRLAGWIVQPPSAADHPPAPTYFWLGREAE